MSNTEKHTNQQIPSLLANADLATRWGVSAQSVRQWIELHPDFPKPVMRVANNRTPLYLELQIEAYEKSDPEFLVWKRRRDKKTNG